MKEFVEKLIERLEKLQEKYKGIRANTHCVVTETSECDSCKSDNYLYARLRSVDEVIKIVNQLAEEFATDINVGSKNQDSTKNNQGWITCGERLPEEPDIQYQALEYFPEYNVTIAGAEQSTTLHYLGDGEWSDAEGNSYNVIAWQQLPEVYCPGEEKDSAKNARTRIECIRSMSLEEIADKIMENENLYAALNFCQNYAKCWEEVDEDECRKCLIKWLNSIEPKKSIPTEHFQERFNRVI